MNKNLAFVIMPRDEIIVRCIFDVLYFWWLLYGNMKRGEERKLPPYLYDKFLRAGNKKTKENVKQGKRKRKKKQKEKTRKIKNKRK